MKRGSVEAWKRGSDGAWGVMRGAGCGVRNMKRRTKSILLGLAAVVGALRLAPEGGPVTVAFVRYERAANNWHAYMQICNNTSRPVFYRSASTTSTHYVWESPQIDYAWRLESPKITLPPRSKALFRVLVMTADNDWRVGVDYEIPPPTWSAGLPRWLLDRANRLGIIKWGERRAWSPQVRRVSQSEIRTRADQGRERI